MSQDVTKERLFEEFNSVVAETEKLLESLAGAGNEKAGALQAKVAQQLADAGERLAKIRGEALDYAQENPWRAVGVVAIAAGLAGLVAGVLIARR